MPHDFWFLAGLGLLIALVLFTATWALSLRLDNFSFVDVTWAGSLALLAPLYGLCGDGYGGRRALATIMGVQWALRLGGYLFLRVKHHHPNEDVRYQVLRKQWQGHLASRFFWFFQAQGLLIWLLSMPVLLACLNPAPHLTVLELGGALVWLIGWCGEALSDAQMAAFKHDPSNKGKVCQAGLWAHSRHPNYFFESVTWWGFWLFACGSPWGWATVYAPLSILFFLLRVTGIPLTEKCAVESKGEAYREYQRTTSAFVPWARKTEPR